VKPFFIFILEIANFSHIDFVLSAAYNQQSTKPTDWSDGIQMTGEADR